MEGFSLLNLAGLPSPAGSSVAKFVSLPTAATASNVVALLFIGSDGGWIGRLALVATNPEISGLLLALGFLGLLIELANLARYCSSDRCTRPRSVLWNARFCGLRRSGRRRIRRRGLFSDSLRAARFARPRFRWYFRSLRAANFDGGRIWFDEPRDGTPSARDCHPAQRRGRRDVHAVLRAQRVPVALGGLPACKGRTSLPATITAN